MRFGLRWWYRVLSNSRSCDPIAKKSCSGLVLFKEMAASAGMPAALARQRSSAAEEDRGRPFLPAQLHSALPAEARIGDSLPEHEALQSIKKSAKAIEEIDATVFTVDLNSSLEPHAVAEA